MKPGPNSKRSRGRGNPRRPNSNNPRGQVYESNGPDVRIRGTVNQVLDKYLTLARDATSAGDHVAAENFFQHAEHYYRILSANGGFHNGLQRFRPGVPQGQQNQPQGQPQNQPQAQPRPAGERRGDGGNGGERGQGQAPDTGGSSDAGAAANPAGGAQPAPTRAEN